MWRGKKIMSRTRSLNIYCCEEKECPGFKRWWTQLYLLFITKGKGIVNPEMKIQLLTVMLFQTSKTFCSSLEHKIRYFWWNPGAFCPCIGSNAADTLRKVGRTLLKWSMWHQWFNHIFMKLRKYFLCTKKRDNYFFSSVHSWQYHDAWTKVLWFWNDMSELLL